LIIPVYPEEGEPIPVLVASGHLAQESEAVANLAADGQAFLAVTTPAPTPSDASVAINYPASSPTSEPEIEVARQIVRSNVEAAMREEITLLRQRLESQLQKSVQEIVKSLSERIAERVLNAVVEQTAERTATTVAEARENGQRTTEELDAMILSATREAWNAQALARTSRKRSRKSPK
jgi:hypothetical protein